MAPVVSAVILYNFDWKQKIRSYNVNKKHGQLDWIAFMSAAKSHLELNYSYKLICAIFMFNDVLTVHMGTPNRM